MTAPAATSNVTLVRDGDVVRLVHDQTGKNLHSHGVRAPITDNEREVSGYGEGKAGNATLDLNDNWRIVWVDVTLWFILGYFGGYGGSIQVFDYEV